MTTFGHLEPFGSALIVAGHFGSLSACVRRHPENGGSSTHTFFWQLNFVEHRRCSPVPPYSHSCFNVHVSPAVGGAVGQASSMTVTSPASSTPPSPDVVAA